MTEANDSLDDALHEGPPVPRDAGERIRGTVEAALFGAPPPAPRWIGKYRVDECVGQGAMGEVFAAHDDVLDRKVALKLVRQQRASPSATARLIQEAKSLARLDHPNVVRVHEAGFVDERAWIAMQFVAGPTLRVWVEQAPRSSKEVLDALCEAGRGLAAAHEAGLVHRDFKPDNVLVSDDGVVRVVDFGLVHFFAETDPGPSDWASRSIPIGVRGLLDEGLTQEGAVMGTPVYMPPEQLAGGRVDARSDQFAFCVTCWEALFGMRPFTGATRAELVEATVARQFQPGAEARRVPKRIVRALRRGLSARPERRFESMDALLKVLDRGRSRGPWILAAAGVVAAGTIWQVAGGSTSACSAPPHASDLWSDASAAGMRDAFEATELPFAVNVAVDVNGRLDLYSASWARAHAEVCEDDAYAETREQRLACLDVQRLRVKPIVQRLQEPDRAVVEHALDLLAQVPHINQCLTPDGAIGHAMPLSSEFVEATADARVRAAAGQSEVVVGLATSIIEQARESSDVVAEIDALQVRAQAHFDLARDDAAVKDLMEAGNLAIKNDLDAQSAAVWIELTDVGASVLRSAERADEWSLRAEAYVERAGGDPTGGGWDLARAYVLQLHDPSAARQAFDDILKAERDPNSNVAQEARSSKAAVTFQLGKSEEAAAEYREILRTRHRRYGRSHPLTANAAYNLGAALDQDGSDEAERYHRWAYDVWSALYPDGNIDVASARIALGNIDLKAANVAAARTHADMALAILRTHVDADDTRMGEGWTLAGAVAHAEGDYDQAAAAHEKARRIYERQLGANSPNTAIAESNRAEALLHEGRFDEARRGFDRGVQLLSALLGAKHPYVAFPRKGLGLIALAQGRISEATSLLRAAREQMGRLDPIETLEIEAALAWAARSTDTELSIAMVRDAEISAELLGPYAVQRVEALERLVHISQE